MTDWNAPLRFPDGRVWDVLEARVCEEEDERRCDFEVQERQRQIYRHFILIVRESAIRRGDFADDTEVLCFARHWVASHLSSNAQELAYSRCCRAVIGECE